MQRQGFERDCWINSDFSNQIIAYKQKNAAEKKLCRVWLYCCIQHMLNEKTEFSTGISPQHIGCGIAGAIILNDGMPETIECYQVREPLDKLE